MNPALVKSQTLEEEETERIMAAWLRSRATAAKRSSFSAAARRAARTSRRRTRTTGDARCCTSAAHTPRDRTSTPR